MIKRVKRREREGTVLSFSHSPSFPLPPFSILSLPLRLLLYSAPPPLLPLLFFLARSVVSRNEAIVFFLSLSLLFIMGRHLSFSLLCRIVFFFLPHYYSDVQTHTHTDKQATYAHTTTCHIEALGLALILNIFFFRFFLSFSAHRFALQESLLIYIFAKFECRTLIGYARLVLATSTFLLRKSQSETIFRLCCEPELVTGRVCVSVCKRERERERSVSLFILYSSFFLSSIFSFFPFL